MARIDLHGIHRVRTKLKSGAIREYHYAWRGGPRFWSSDSDVKKGSAAYMQALADAAPRGEKAAGKFRSILLRYLDSAEFKALAPRTRSDILKSVRHQTNGIDAKFGEAPIAAFNDPRIRRKVLDWREKIGGKVGDDRLRHLQQIIGWALDRGLLEINRLTRVKSIYKSNRAEILWTDAEIETFIERAPPHVSRILIAATETGLRPGDLVGLGRFHVQTTPAGRRLVVRTKKRGRLASIPVTRRMAELIDATPASETTFLRGSRGKPYKHENYLGDAVSDWRDRINAAAESSGQVAPLRADLRLYDARGTAATRLLNAGGEIREIATAMGWSIKQATDVIERYVALHPTMTDALGEKIARLERDTL